MQFSYKARTKEGELQVGVIEAGSRGGAMDILQRHDLIITELKEEKQKGLLTLKLKFFQGVKPKEMMIFSRQLSTLFESKIPLVESLRTLSVQTENEYFKDVIIAISGDVDSGTSLSAALEKHPGVFSAFYINMVKAGEVSGKLQEVFLYLADHEERDYAIASKAKSAMIYPVVILGFFFLVFLLMLLFVIPQLKEVLVESKVELPLITRAVLAASDIVKGYWYLLLIGIFGTIAAAYRFMQTEYGQSLWDKVKVRIPVFGDLFLKIYITRFCENLSTLIVGGLPILQALQVTADVIGSKKFEQIIKTAIEEVRRGNPINSVLKKYEEFPPLVVSMIAVGESTGKLDYTLKNLATFYQREINSLIDNIVSLIEPLMIGILGIGTGLFLAAILTPIYNIANSIQ
jgi:type IV pilus assembly protein PilC